MCRSGLLFLFLSNLSLFAQQVEVTRYDVDDGLPQSMVNHVLQDSRGFIWLGTGDGLARFDGQRFVVYKHDPQDSTSLSQNSIWGLAEGPDRQLYVGTRGGLDVLDPDSGHFMRTRTDLNAEADGCWRPVRQNTRGNLFYSPIASHLLEVDQNGTKTRRLHHHASYAMYADPHTGVLAQVVWPDTLLTISPNGGERIDRLPTEPNERITELLPFGKGWLVLTDRSAWTWSHAHGRKPLPPATQAWMDHRSRGKYGAISSDGRIWVGLSGTGVVVLDANLHVVHVYPLLPANERPLDITTVTFDHQGNTWVGTDGKGVFKIAPQRIQFGRCMPGQGALYEPNSWFVRGFAQWDRHQVLVNFYQGGLALFDERTQQLAPLELPVASRKALDIPDLFGPVTDRSGILWFRDTHHVFAVEPLNGKLLHHAHTRTGNVIACGPDGDVVVLTHDGSHAMRRREHAVTVEELPSVNLRHWLDSLKLMASRMAFDREGRLLVCQNLIPITAWHNDRRISAGPFNPEVRFTALLPGTDDDLWMTSNDGLYLLDAKDLAVKEHWTVHDGLPDQFTYAAIPVDDGTLWISTNKGLSQFDPGANTFANYGPEHGLQSAEFNSNAYFRSASGRLYFGGINGFNFFTPDHIRNDPDTAKVVLLDITAQDMPVDLGGLSTPPRISLPYGRNHLLIDLAVLEFTAPERNRYRYRVIGYTDWAAHPADRPITLTNMPAGTYALEVIGLNADGLASSPNRLLTIHVPLPFRASPWFYILLGALLIAAMGAGAFFWYRQRVLRREERAAQELKELRIRARIAQDLHDDVGSGLARITSLARAAEKRSRTGEPVNEQIGKVSDLSKELMDDLRDVVWVNDPRGGDLPELLIRIKNHFQDLFEGAGTNCSVIYPSPLPERTIGPIARRNLFLIAKEAAHNAHKHGGGQDVTLSFQMDAERIHLSVTNEGSTTNSKGKGGGHGLRNMRERAEALGCILHTAPTTLEGYQVVLDGPLAALDL